MAQKPTGNKGDIHVSMGDGNSVGDIGHKTIVVNGPPPDPLLVYQNDRQVGRFLDTVYKLSGENFVKGSTFTSAGITLAPDVDLEKPFDINGHPFTIDSYRADAFLRKGFGPGERELQMPICSWL